MKRVWQLIAIMAVIIFGTAATTYIQGVLHPGVISFNGQIEEVSEEYGILNYKDHVYVPIRYIAKHTGSEIFYDHETKQIAVYQMNGKHLASKVNASESEVGYNLSIYSAKTAYKASEPLHIWAVLRNDSGEAKHFSSGDPVITFYFKDPDGKIFLGNLQHTVAKQIQLNSNDQIHIQLPYSPEAYYLAEEGQVVNLGEKNEPFFLPKGQYTVGALADIGDSDIGTIKLSPEIMIEIE